MGRAGGEAASDRFGVRRNQDGDPPGRAKPPAKGEPKGPLEARSIEANRREGERLRKSQDGEVCRTIARAHGWRTAEMSGETMQLHHSHLPGHVLTIGGDGGAAYGSQRQARRVGRPGELNAHLMETHGVT